MTDNRKPFEEMSIAELEQQLYKKALIYAIQSFSGFDSKLKQQLTFTVLEGEPLPESAPLSEHGFKAVYAR